LRLNFQIINSDKSVRQFLDFQARHALEIIPKTSHQITLSNDVFLRFADGIKRSSKFKEIKIK